MRQLLLMICCFLVGVCIGSLVVPSSRSNKRIPISADFCFVVRNPSFFESTRFITYASISSAQPHGYILTSPSCPDLGVPFRQRLDREDLRKQVQQKLRDDPYTSIPILFEGTVYTRSTLAVWWDIVKTRLRLSKNEDPNGTVTIRAFKAVGEQTWDQSTQSWRSAHP
jgi:hypothetical protein